MMPKKREPEVDLGRRRISAAAALALLGGATITIAGCGGGGGPSGPSAGPAPTPAPTPTTGTGNGDKVGQVSDDSRHQAVITAAQLSAGGALTLDIQGKAPHGHIVELTPHRVVQLGGAPVRSAWPP